MVTTKIIFSYFFRESFPLQPNFWAKIIGGSPENKHDDTATHNTHANILETFHILFPVQIRLCEKDRSTSTPTRIAPNSTTAMNRTENCAVAIPKTLFKS